MSKIQKTKDGFFHYKMCGLDYIYLANGFEIRETPYGESIVIHQLDKLHLAIGKDIVSFIKRIRGQELRFFRSELDFTQAKMAKLFCTTLRTYQAWEADRKKPISLLADKIMRMIYLEFIGQTVAFSKVSEILDAMQEKSYKRFELQETSEGWVTAA